MNDAAHSLGARYFDKNIGTECDVTIFSLHAVKNVTTAEGGAICLNMPAVFDNAYGKGIVINGEVMYWYSQDCNIHYPENKKEDNNETS